MTKFPEAAPATHAADPANGVLYCQESLCRKPEPILSIIIPVYNEVRTINQLIQRVLATPHVTQIIVVDDGSIDGTSEIIRKWEDQTNIELLQHSHNRGKGAAIRTGLEYVRGRFTIVQDADLEYDPQDYSSLIAPLVAGRAQVVYGSRYLSVGRQFQPGGRLFRWGVRLLNLAVRLLYGAKLSDEATCYKVFPTAILKSMNLECERFEFCPEVTAKVCRMGLRILEVPVSYHARTAEAGKKIRWRDGLAALQTLWRWRNWQPKSMKDSM